MTERCHTIQEELTCAAGRVEELGAAARAHVAACEACAAVAEEERVLAAALAQMLPPHDPVLEGAVLARIRSLERRRRALAALPLAAGLVLAAVGALLVGGVPGAGVLAALPATSLAGCLGLVRGAGGAVVAVRLLAEVTPPWLAMGALAAAVVSARFLLTVVRRGPEGRPR